MSKLSRDKKGRFMKGYHYSPSTEWTKENYYHYDRTGETITEEHKQAISKFMFELGENNPTKRPEIKERLRLSKLGDKNPAKRSEVRAKIREKRKGQRIPTHHTECELIFFKICKDFQLPFDYVGDSAFWIGRMNPDFKHNNGKKKVIEVYGDYWHKGEDPQVRIDAFKKHGWDCMVVWEHELKEKPENIVEKVKMFLEVVS